MDECVRTLEDGRVFVDYGPASMVITARRGSLWLSELAAAAFPLIQTLLAEIAAELPTLRLFPRDADFSALRGLPRQMSQAVLATGEPTLTPMAAVAGAVADRVADWLFAREADFVAVNNGGDIALRLGPDRSMKLGILPTLNGSVREVVTIRAEDGIGGVCTSGLGGRSLTRGIADAVTVFAKSCALADACATQIANCSYLDSPRVHTLRAGALDPQSDIADLTVVCSVDKLQEAEIDRGLEQIRAEAERQLRKSNLLYTAAHIQGKSMWFPRALG